ncbi:hypothetical protein GCM10022403_039180 [Streptomyces coacervatus]|uniref:Uncharacterized protein n=1 Tax=Streptomyces coacervatus TaxID=647381 RepID=A0ABP7HR48_9ACTN|nr:hypothetical protein [Streptomyces coacervatus]MDF2270676.1 hypothetical protein [Streptomyces coacervatus]
MITRIEIDPNVRVRGNGTRAGFEDVRGPIAVNMPVEVFEPESGLVGPGRVTEIDPARRLVFLSVEWSKLEERPNAGEPTETLEMLAKIRCLPVSPTLRAPTSVLRPHIHTGLQNLYGELREAGQSSEELVVSAL